MAARVDRARYHDHMATYARALDRYWVEHNGVGGYDDPVPFGPIDLAPGPATLSTSENGDHLCDPAAWLDLELSPR